MKKFNKDIGNYSEILAINYLKKDNYIILEHNFRNFLGELDIICKRSNTIIVIEVKSRYDCNYGLPRESVTYSKQRNIIKVTLSYISYRNLNNFNIRFDVIEVYFNRSNSTFNINHIKDAFRIS